jgi:site-specific recombinase XerD
MKGNRSSQPKRGQWKKDRSERGVFRRGKTWYIRFSDGGGKVRVEAVGPSKALAIKVCAKRRTEVAERRFFPASGVSIEEIVDDAIQRARDRFKINHPDKQFKPGNYEIVKGWFPKRAADSLTSSEIAEKLSGHSEVPATFNRFRVAISHAFKIALENKKVTENPGRLVRMQKENNERVRYLNQFSLPCMKNEESQLREALGNLYPDKEPEIDLALHTGIRWSEQYGLRWPNVDLARNDIKVVRPKGGKDQHIPINAKARRALQDLKALAPKSEFVCPANDYHQHRGWWLAVLKAAALGDFHWHDLRHTFASRLVMSGVDIFTVCRLMRHQNVQTTMRYTHLADKHLAAAVGRLEGVTTGDTTRGASRNHTTYLQ